MVQFERSASPRPDNNTTTKTALLKKSAGITSRSPCPRYIPIPTGIKALVEITKSIQLNLRLDDRNIASSADERTRKSDASLVNSLPRKPFATRYVNTSGPGIAAIPPSAPPAKPAATPTGVLRLSRNRNLGATNASPAPRTITDPAIIFVTAGSPSIRTITPTRMPGIIPSRTGIRRMKHSTVSPPSRA